jgi:hypothetical protein
MDPTLFVEQKNIIIAKDVEEAIDESIEFARNKKIEFEIRLGTINRNRFVTDINVYVFSSLLLFLKEKASFEKTIDTVSIYRTDSYSKTLRHIRNSHGDVYQYKTKLFTKDVKTFFMYKTDIRFSVSEETETEIVPDEIKFLIKRERERHTFKFDGYKIELTRITSRETTYEIEIEYLAPDKDIVKKSLQMLIPPFLFISDYVGKAISAYNQMFRNEIKQKGIVLKQGLLFRYENHPRNIKKPDISHMFNNKIPLYSSTNKLNGNVYYLVLDRNNAYFINQSNCFYFIIEQQFSRTLLHGEFFNGQYNIFDCLISNYKNISALPHSQRLKQVPQINTKFFKTNIKQFFSGKLSDSVLKCKKYIDETFKRGDNDGIIFTPVGEYFDGPILKWKFPEMMSIDFQLANEKMSDNNKMFDLLVYSENGNVVFSTMSIDNKNKLFDKISSGMIVECVYENNKFKAYKIRNDKDKPNYISVANDVFSDMKNPFTFESLIQSIESAEGKEIKEEKGKECLDEMRKYNNLVKKNLINKFSKNANVLDLGFGRGGDIWKYSQNKTKLVIGVEPNKENRDESKQRIKQVIATDDNITKFVVLPFKAQENLLISEKLERKNVDVVSSFFSLTFFFENEDELDKLCNTVSQNLRIGGKFIGTFMDGNETFKLLQGKEKIENECFKIEKKYVDSDKTNFGMKINIHLKDTIVNEQEEYLSFFDILKNKLEKWGLKFISSEMFSFKSQNKTINQLTNLYRWFIFERVKTEKEIKQEIYNEENIKLIKKLKENELSPLKHEYIEEIKLEYDKSEGDKFVRIGTIGDGSCFFHSVLSSLGFDEYKTSHNKTKFIYGYREAISNSLTFDRWRELGKEQFSLQLLIANFGCLINMFGEYSNFKCINGEKLSDIYSKNLKDVKNIEEYTAYIGKYFDDDKTKLFTREKITNVLAKIDKLLYKKYKIQIKNPSVWVGQSDKLDSIDVFEYLSDILDINIFIINDRTRKLYNEGIDFNIRFKNRKSVVLLWIQDNKFAHYESIGIERDGNVVTLFDYSDQFIQQLVEKIKND